MSRSGGGRRRCWSRSAATGAPAAGTCGARTPAGRPSRGRSCRGAGCGGRWKAIVCQHLTVARVAEALGVSWNTANDAVLAEGRRVLINDPARFDGVTRDRGRRARLAPHPPRRQVRHRDHRPHPGPRRHRPGAAAGHGRGPLQAGVQDLARRPRRRPGATGSRSSRWTGSPASRPPPAEELPDAVAVMDPFHVVAPGRRRPGPVPPPRPARHSTATAAARTTRSTAPPHPAHRRRPAHRQATPAARRPCSPTTRTSRSRPPGASTSA